HPDRRDARCARSPRDQLHRSRVDDVRERPAAGLRQGLQDLEAQTKTLFPSATKFSALTTPQQIQVLNAMEKTPFFNLVRTHTVRGFFQSQTHGGNYNKGGWKLVNYADSLNHKPPFGYYDAQPSPRGH